MKHSITFESSSDAGDDILVSAEIDSSHGEPEIETLTATLDGEEIELTVDEVARIEESIWASFWEDVGAGREHSYED